MTDRTAPSSDARKRHHERDMADAHATARARDARVEESFEERAERYGLDWDVVAHLMSEQPTRRAYRTRTQAIDPETGTFTPLTQEPDMTDQPEPYDFHDEAHRALLNDDLSKGWQAGLHALLAIHDTLTEIRDRLPERTEVKVAPFDPDLVAANIAALKHELETPMREHGECCEPAPTDDLPGEPVKDEPEKTHPCPGCGTFTGKRVCNSCWGTSDDPEAGYSQAECIEAEPAPADDLPGEPVEPGDLRAGDRVAFTYRGERITTLVSDRNGNVLRSDTPDSRDFCPNVAGVGGAFIYGISDVRLLERAPREDESPDEALARVIFGDAYGSHEGLRLAQLDVALMARKHIEAEQEDAVAFLREEVESLTARAERAEAERDALRERLDALRADLSPGGLVWAVDAALARDDERAAKGEQR